MKYTALLCAMAAIGLAACTQDELTDGTLPEGKYPLVINATGLQTATLDTRATVDGNWDGVESVAVQVGDEVKEYSVTAGTEDPTKATLSNDADPFYWDAMTMTVSAWHPYGETMPEVVVVDADQSTKDNFTASDFISAENQTVTFGDNSTPTLAFSHRTARVRVILKGDEMTSVDGATVSLIDLTTEGGNPATISAYKSADNTFEALLHPQTISANGPFIQVVLNGKTYSYGLAKGITLEANHRYTYNVDIPAQNMVLTSCIISGWEEETPVNAVTAQDYITDDQGTYIVYTGAGLKAVADLISGGDYDINVKLDRDIDLTGVDWMPIANNVNAGSVGGYSGTFDGQGHRITGLRIENPSEERFKHIALFKSIGEGGTVKNLQLVNVDFDAGKSMCGGIAVYNYGTITACSVTGTLVSSPEGTGSTGGIVYTNNKTITACWFNGDLDGMLNSDNSKKIGGIAVTAEIGSVFTACYWGGNAEEGADVHPSGATVEATKVNDGESWQSAIDGMNAALSGNDYEWALGTDGQPVLKKK